MLEVLLPVVGPGIHRYAIRFTHSILGQAIAAL